MGWITDIESFLCPGDRHVEQPAFFFKIGIISARWQCSIIAAEQEDGFEFQSFAGMDGHKLHAVVMRLDGSLLHLCQLVL